MHLQTIVYVTNMDRSIEWYRKLLGTDPTATSEYWTPFSVGGSTLALHVHDRALGAGSVELSLVSNEALTSVIERMGVDAEIVEQPFGRSFALVDPDGTQIQVNEHQ